VNPFASKFTNFSGEPLIVLAADDRIRMVQDFGYPAISVESAKC